MSIVVALYYANPHAVTGLWSGSATTTYAYDANGNLMSTTGAATSTYTYDYKNRLITAWVNSATSTYAYDHTTSRVRQTIGATVTDYPNKFYSLTGATSTAYLWAGDTLVAYVEGNGTATSTYYVHPDHLGSTNTVTNQAGSVVQTLDYYPYGAQRIASSTSGVTSQRNFIGQFTDSTNLSYLNARYYEGSGGSSFHRIRCFGRWGRRKMAEVYSRTRKHKIRIAIRKIIR